MSATSNAMMALFSPAPVRWDQLMIQQNVTHVQQGPFARMETLSLARTHAQMAFCCRDSAGRVQKATRHGALTARKAPFVLMARPRSASAHVQTVKCSLENAKVLPSRTVNLALLDLFAEMTRYDSAKKHVLRVNICRESARRDHPETGYSACNAQKVLFAWTGKCTHAEKHARPGNSLLVNALSVQAPTALPAYRVQLAFSVSTDSRFHVPRRPPVAWENNL